MGILDRDSQENNNCQNNSFQQENLNSIYENSIFNIYNQESCTNQEKLDEFQIGNLKDIYENSDWRLFQTPIDKPFSEVDSDGSITYFWYYGDILDLKFDLNGEMVVEDDTILYYYRGQTPTEDTAGTIGQKAYNIIDNIQWTLVSIDGDRYMWQQDEEYIPPITGSRHVYFTIQDYIKDKNICIKIQDFKYNTIYEQNFDGSQEIVLHVSKELSDTMVPGIYYLHLQVVDQNSNNVLLGINKYRLLVK